jgi:predicted RNA-binding protein with PUA domain
MVNNLTEEDILHYLMTSDFSEGLTPDEFKFLLAKFRNFYRVSNGKTEMLKNELDVKIKEISEMKSSNQNAISVILSEKANVENEYRVLQNRKLSWKERWSGKIIIEKNETK